MKRIKVLLTAVVLCTGVLMSSCAEKQTSEPSSTQDIKVFDSFFTEKGTPLTENNVIQELIAEKTGAKCVESWLGDSQNASDVISQMIISSEYPDFIYADSGLHVKLLDAGAYIPIDEYWDDYPNIKNFFTDEQWNKIRDKDGHIYIIPQFSNVHLYDTATIHVDEAFWIQVRVLKWAGYPKINTLDEYFDLIDRYLEANPTDSNGNANIGYDILTDGWLYFCLENPPQFLDGYPNDGCCIVDPDTLTAKDYNTTDTAKRWFKKLNEEYKKGTIDKECFLLTEAQYKSKLASGCVLGMVDQYWNYSNSTDQLPDECEYVPLGIVIDDGIEEHYHSSVELNASSGLGISVDCDDIEGAMKFVNDLLSPEILNLRFWGIEGEDYSVDSNGIFSAIDNSDKVNDIDHFCRYSYFPFYCGMNLDGKNAYNRENQPSQFFEERSDIMKECLSAYGAKTYVEMLNRSKENSAWFPLWSYSNTFTDKTVYGKAKNDMDKIKHEYLPKVVMSDDFEAEWEAYMKAYSEQCDTKSYLDELTNEVKRRSGK